MKTRLRESEVCIHCFTRALLTPLRISNRIDEASTLWDSVSNSRWFAQSSLVLFLNKTGKLLPTIELTRLVHYQGANHYRT